MELSTIAVITVLCSPLMLMFGSHITAATERRYSPHPGKKYTVQPKPVDRRPRNMDGSLDMRYSCNSMKRLVK